MAGFLNTNIQEYVFARVIEDYNLDQRAKGSNDFISARDGRALHAAWLDAVREQPRYQLNEKGERVPVLDGEGNPVMMDLSTVSPLAVRETIASSFSAFSPRFEGFEVSASAYHRYVSDWERITGIAASRGPARSERLAHGVTFTKSNLIPFSPFAEEFSQRQTMLEHGTEILYARPDDVLVQTREGDGPYDLQLRNITMAQMYRMEPIPQFYSVKYQHENDPNAPAEQPSDSWSQSIAGPMVTVSDVAGISRLREFMTSREFLTASRWMNIPESQRMTASMVDHSVAILEMLRDHGIPYSIRPDQRPGQLKAVIGNTKMSVRITDIQEPGRSGSLYIGRVYADGNSFYLSPQNKGLMGVYQPTIEDTLQVVLYGMGHSIDRSTPLRRLHGKVGTVSEFRVPGSNEAARRTTYLGPARNGKLWMTALYGTIQDPNVQAANGKNAYLFIQSGNNHSSSHMDFPTQDAAERFLREAVASARANFEKKVNIDYLVAEHNAHPEPDYVPILSGDPTLLPVQLSYWNVLRGKQVLYEPTNEEHLDQAFSELIAQLNAGQDDAELDVSAADQESDVQTEYDIARDANKYVGTAEGIIRQHLKDNMDAMFGSYEPDAHGIRFSPSLVASYMESAMGVARNEDNLIAAMRTLQFTGDELRGNDFDAGTIKDKLLRFNPEQARPMTEAAKTSGYMRLVLDTIVTTLRETACEVDPENVLIDNMGVVHYKARVLFSSTSGVYRDLEGEIGQIFVPDEDGIVETKYNGSANRLFTPGYEAYIVPETEETRGQPLESRYRFRGLPQILHENIERQIRYDVQNIEETVSDVQSSEGMVFHAGTTTSINNTYHGLYHTGYRVAIERKPQETLKEAYIRQMEATHMPRSVLSEVFATARGMVHFDKEIIEGSSVSAEYTHNQQAQDGMTSIHTLTNDNMRDPYELTGHANMAITAENSSRLFDPVMTGSGKNQGAIRYFVVGAGVNADGTPHFSEHEGPLRAPILRTADQKYADFIPADRQQMEVMNYMSAFGVAGSRKVGVAQLTLQGMTFDDGAVISKSFAEQYGMIDDKGAVRPLKAGDKICDMAGNKSIIACVIDRDMPLEEAKEKGIDLAVQLFQKNPTLDVVQAPYSAVSRFNAAGVRHAMESPNDLILPDGTVHKGCIGYMPMVITHHTAEDHTKSYDDESVKQGKGRKISTQQTWMFCAKGAVNMLKEVFGSNSAVVNLREYLNVIGYDMSETGDLRFGYQPHHGESRYLFPLPDNDTLDHLSDRDLGSLFSDTVGSRGGFMELPFSLELLSGVSTMPADADRASRSDQPLYMLPVMSSYLRSGQAFEDGRVRVHDYTNQYLSIYKNAVSYLKLQNELASAPDGQKDAIEKQMQNLQHAAQMAYNAIADDVFARKFESKHNIARDEIMARRMPNSATAVWTPQPNLKLHQVAMPESLAATLNVKEGDRILVSRDPLLRTYGTRDMEVVIDNDLHGVAVNPLIAVSFDGDFDGDSVGLWNPRTEASKEESYRLFSFEQNMLDFSHVRENGDYALMINDSMDLISAEAIDQERHAQMVSHLEEQYGSDSTAVAALPETLFARRMRLEHAFNEVYRDSSLSSEERIAKNKALMEELSDYAHDVMVPQIGTELVSYLNPSEHMRSLISMVDHGAKGNMKKLNHYMRYAGFEAEHDESGRILADTVVDHGRPLVTEQDLRDTELATAIKSHGTGNAGSISQKAALFLRNRGLVADELAKQALVPGQKPQPQNVLEPALRLTYLGTQGILQAKHDPVQAKMLYSMLQSELRDLWRGHKMVRKDRPDGSAHWVCEKDADGKFIQATPDEWISTFMDIHTAKNGLDLGGCINIDDVRQTAAALTGPDGTIMNVDDFSTIVIYAAPLDVLAYRQGDAKNYLRAMAENHSNLFAGEMSRYFAPDQVLKNMQAAREGRVEDLVPIQPSDTKEIVSVSSRHSILDLNVQNTGQAVRAKDAAAAQSTSFDAAAQARVAGKLPQNPGAKPAGGERAFDDSFVLYYQDSVSRMRSISDACRKHVNQSVLEAYDGLSSYCRALMDREGVRAVKQIQSASESFYRAVYSVAPALEPDTISRFGSAYTEWAASHQGTVSTVSTYFPERDAVPVMSESPIEDLSVTQDKTEAEPNPSIA